jgi:pimeloyl-ACP methyl ester carboxylesterase
MLPSIKKTDMASRNPNRAPKPTRKPQDSFKRYPPRPPVDPNAPPDVVDPAWLVKALGLTLLTAVLCAYLAVCLLVYQGGWQLLLHPSHTITATPSAAFTPIRFDSAETGNPRLAAWWIPAESPNANTPTILFLHDGSGSLSSAAPALDLLHTANLNIFAFDYRGFGQSAGPHPTEAQMAEDANAALTYLTDTRHIATSTIIPYGQGLGAVLAAQLANTHANIPAVIIDSPHPNAFAEATHTGQSRFLPMRLLVQEHFDLVEALKSSKTPKLLLSDDPFHSTPSLASANQAVFRTLPDPKRSVTFGRPGASAEYLQAIHRFLDEYLPH